MASLTVRSVLAFTSVLEDHRDHSCQLQGGCLELEQEAGSAQHRADGVPGCWHTVL